ncbi:MAG: hypothetical protein OQK24_10055, partial [Magnetovibrio sp.]|nr:hypothetical protein [Magnetovibrio sp.]
MDWLKRKRYQVRIDNLMPTKRCASYSAAFCSLLLLVSGGSGLQAADGKDSGEELLIENDEVLVIEEESGPGPELVIEESAPGGGAEGGLLIEEEDSLVIETPGDESAEPATEMAAVEEPSSVSLELDELWAEFGYFPDSNAYASSQSYLHGQVTASWRPSSRWELQASARVDGFSQSGGADWDHLSLDYGETFIQYRADSYRITAGMQKVLWGRIDEFPPTDRVSTQDLSRYIMDDLSDRRRASAAIRFEHFSGSSKLDLVFLPHFREAELPGVDSVWFPVNQRSGEILGLPSTPASRALVQSSPVETRASDSDGGFGIRYSNSGSGMDYAITLQKVRQSLPYFNYNSARGVLEARYPRSWMVGGDIGFEAAGAVWRLEGGWLSDAPVTRTSGAYDTVRSVNWGAGMEFFPGDGDTRVNLQLTGVNHIDAPAVIDRREV